MSEDKLTKIVLIDGGPIVIEGFMKVTDSDGKVLVNNNASEKSTVAICRCTKSKNKPYCDGSHLK